LAFNDGIIEITRLFRCGRNLGTQAIPGQASGVGDSVVLSEQPVREEALLEMATRSTGSSSGL
jgi:hypothetical protein